MGRWVIPEKQERVIKKIRDTALHKRLVKSKGFRHRVRWLRACPEYKKQENLKPREHPNMNYYWECMDCRRGGRHLALLHKIGEAWSCSAPTIRGWNHKQVSIRKWKGHWQKLEARMTEEEKTLIRERWDQ